MFLKQDIKFNISITILDKLKRKIGLLDFKKEKGTVNKIKKNLEINIFLFLYGGDHDQKYNIS